MHATLSNLDKNSGGYHPLLSNFMSKEKWRLKVAIHYRVHNRRHAVPEMRHIECVVVTNRTLPALRSRSSVSRNSSVHPKLLSNQHRCTGNHVFNPRFVYMQYVRFDDPAVLPPTRFIKWGCGLGTSFDNQTIFSLFEGLTSKKEKPYCFAGEHKK